uniref:DNA-binding protein GT-1 n=1 Tax=Rhizophora mucronata TaxID=61149 RepID=A0A2P2N7I9_RHIMU
MVLLMRWQITTGGNDLDNHVIPRSGCHFFLVEIDRSGLF